jgi:predicted amidophosphoribosyltransferase
VRERVYALHCAPEFQVTKPILGACRCCGDKVSSEARRCPHCGQPRPFAIEVGKGLPDWEVRAREIARSNKIDAIRLVREATGYGLTKAKDIVESWER